MPRTARTVLLVCAALALAACTVTTSGYVRTEVTTAPQPNR